MVELVSQMVFWLVAAIILGFLIGWFFSATRENVKYGKALKEAKLEIAEKKEEIEKFEQIFQNQEKRLEALMVDYKNSKIALSDKNILLAKMKERVEKAKKIQEDYALNLKNKPSDDEGSNMEVREELEEFEKVLLKAEETIEASNKKIKELEKEIERISLENKNYKERIAEVEKEVTPYSSNKEDEEFVITKDQFVQIEGQLVEYQKEIEALKQINSEYIQKAEKKSNSNPKESTPKVKVEQISKDSKSKETINLKNRNAANAIKDGAAVKIFKKTYNKITKT